MKKLYLDNVNNGVNESVVSETDMPVTDCSGDVMLMDSDFSTDRGINLTNTTDRNCVESATITEHGRVITLMLRGASQTSTQAVVRISFTQNRNMDIENRIESVSRRLCFTLHSTRSRTLQIHKGKY